MYLRHIVTPRPLTPNLQRGDLTGLRGKLRQIQFSIGFNSFHHITTFRKPTSWSKLVRQIFYYLGSCNDHINILFFSSCPVVSDSLGPHGLQHAKPPCPSPSPKVCPSSCPLHWWCHPAISSSDALSSFCPQSFPASGTFPLSQLSTLDDQNTRYKNPYIYIYIYIHTHIHIYIHTYTHTHTYIYTHTCIYIHT